MSINQDKFILSSDVRKLSQMDSDQRDKEIFNLFQKATSLTSLETRAKLFFIPLIIGPAHEQEEHFLENFNSFEELTDAIQSCIVTENDLCVNVKLHHYLMSHNDAMKCSANSLKVVLKGLVHRKPDNSTDVSSDVTCHRQISDSFIVYIVGCYQTPPGYVIKFDQEKIKSKVSALMNFGAMCHYSSQIRALNLSSFNEAIVDGTVECIHAIKQFMNFKDSEELDDKGSEQSVLVELLPDQKHIVLYGQTSFARLRIDPILMGNWGVKKIVDAGFVGGKYVPSRTIN